MTIATCYDHSLLIIECEYWLENDNDIDQDISCIPPQDLSLESEDNLPETRSIVRSIVLLVSLFQSRFVISDAAILWLRFLSAIMRLLGRFSDNISAIATLLPHSIYKRDSILKPQGDLFQKYNM